MNTAAKLSVYGVALALVAGGGWAVGTAVGPFNVSGAGGAGHGDNHSGEEGAGTRQGVGEDAATEAAQIDQLGGMEGASSAGGLEGASGAGGLDGASGAGGLEGASSAGGLATSMGGYTFTPTSTTLTPGSTELFSFRIIGSDGRPLTRYDVEHEKRMHLIVVRRDTAGFQHVHPELRSDGTWTVPLNLPQAGSYRAFADFAPSGAEPTTLGIDLAAPGNFQPRAYPASRVSTVDGYRVSLDGDLVPGQTSKVTLSVSEDGKPVTDLQPYLGAYGHLVALRQGDLAYLHVHPDGTPGDGTTEPGPTVTFYAEVPSAGSYRLFLDFQHGGKVRTAEFTLPAESAGTAIPERPATGDDHAGHGG
ncbi:MAG: hypothetical protein ACRDSE_17600 [Pseudonocardiaceae bacterium]